jgi:tetratricopeptide (TPR) repeat protein
MSEPSGDGDDREFLLRSLEDLEREHDAGDLSDHDYRELRDDYTARAAALLRVGAETAPVPPPAAKRRGLLVLGGVIAFAVLAGVLVAQASGRRDAGDSVSGDIDKSITELLNDAARCFNDRDAECAIERYDEVLARQPTNAEAMTYKGWVQYILLQDPDAVGTLVDAAAANPEYAPVHAFLARVFYGEGLILQADQALDRVLELDPPPDLLAQIEGLRAQVDAALAAASSTTTTTS